MFVSRGLPAILCLALDMAMWPCTVVPVSRPPAPAGPVPGTAAPQLQDITKRFNLLPFYPEHEVALVADITS